jgi:hypothetical protein
MNRSRSVRIFPHEGMLWLGCYRGDDLELEACAQDDFDGFRLLHILAVGYLRSGPEGYWEAC